MARVSTGRPAGAIVTGFNTPALRAAMVGLWAFIAAYTVLNGTFAAQPMIGGALAAGLAGSVVLTQPDERLSRRDSVLLAVGAILAGCAVFAYETPGYDMWAYTFATFLASAQLVRGHYRGGGAAAVGVCLVGAVWGWARGTDLAGFIAVLTLPVIVPATFFGISLVMGRFVRRTRDLRSTAARAQLAEAATLEATELGRIELARVRAEADPLLLQIRERRVIDDDFRKEVALAEATIRDRIRSPRLQHPQLNETIRGLRSAGTSVLLLGEAMEGDRATLGDDLAEAVSALIRHTAPGAAVTIRALPAHAAAALTVVGAAPERSYRIDFAEDGRLLSER